MTAARTLTDADVEAIAEAVERRMRAPKPAKRRQPAESRPPSPEALARMVAKMRRKGIR